MENKKNKGIIIIGPNGIGKGTQSKILAKRDDIYHISTGDVLRAAVSGKTPYGLEAKAYMNRGELVPDEVVLGAFDEYIQSSIADSRYNPETQYQLLDGIPRNYSQIPLVDERVDIKQVLFLDAPREVVTERIKARALKEGRKDDADLGVINTRLNIFYSETMEVINEYQRRGGVTISKIDGSPDGESGILQIADTIEKKLIF